MNVSPMVFANYSVGHAEKDLQRDLCIANRTAIQSPGSDGCWKMLRNTYFWVESIGNKYVIDVFTQHPADDS